MLKADLLHEAVCISLYRALTPASGISSERVMPCDYLGISFSCCTKRTDVFPSQEDVAPCLKKRSYYCKAIELSLILNTKVITLWFGLS